MNSTKRSEEMEFACFVEKKRVRQDGRPVDDLVYDTDESGLREWIHIIYENRQIRHVDVTGLDAAAALAKVRNAI